MDKITVEKEEFWIVCYDHFVAAFEKTPEKAILWKHRHTEETRIGLTPFFAESSLLICDCQSEFSSRLNKSLHVMKARMADKDCGWLDSSGIQCYISCRSDPKAHSGTKNLDRSSNNTEILSGIESSRNY
jgi:hypothetical protein